MGEEHADHRTTRDSEDSSTAPPGPQDERSATAGEAEMEAAERPVHVQRIRAASRKAGEAFAHLSPYTEPVYPHDTHPALVPGIAVDEQRRRYSLDWLIFTIAGLATAAFVVWGVLAPEQVAEVTGGLFDWTMTNAGWLFTVIASVILVFMLGLAVSRYGRIRLGKDDEKPEYSTFSWVAMLFAAGLGVGVFFFGPSEPLTFFISPPPHTAEAETVEALHSGMAQAYYHWGFHAWGIYALVGAAIAYVAFRRGRVPLFSSLFRTLFGRRHSEGLAGQLVDMFAIVATLFGTAASLGLAAVQIAEGSSVAFGVEVSDPVVVLIIAIMACGFIISAISGISRGIRYLSSINIVLTVGVVLTVFFLGPTLFLLNLLPAALMEYIGSLFELMGRSGSWGPETVEFQGWWTVFFWAWWIAWSPFVGVFIGRISRGRTLRQFILCVIFVPSSLVTICFGILGGTSIWMYREGAEGFHDDMSSEEVLFGLIANLPYVEWLPYLMMLVIAIFFITAADSASVIMGILSTRGNPNPKRLVVIFWGLVMAGVASVMILTSGETAITGLQNLLMVAALPFTVVLILTMIAFIRELRSDPRTIREAYARRAVDDAVVEGVEAHGDNFALSVQRTAPGEGAGRDFDTSTAEVTEWYRRTDEDDNPVDYDYGTDSWADGWEPEEGSALERAQRFAVPGTKKDGEAGGESAEQADGGESEKKE